VTVTVVNEKGNSTEAVISQITTLLAIIYPLAIFVINYDMGMFK
jgi:hypothetical protein